MQYFGDYFFGLVHCCFSIEKLLLGVTYYTSIWWSWPVFIINSQRLFTLAIFKQCSTSLLLLTLYSTCLMFSGGYSGTLVENGSGACFLLKKSYTGDKSKSNIKAQSKAPKLTCFYVCMYQVNVNSFMTEVPIYRN